MRERVSVCVSVCERERENEREKISNFKSIISLKDWDNNCCGGGGGILDHMCGDDKLSIRLRLDNGDDISNQSRPDSSRVDLEAAGGYSVSTSFCPERLLSRLL